MTTTINDANSVPGETFIFTVGNTFDVETPPKDALFYNDLTSFAIAVPLGDVIENKANGTIFTTEATDLMSTGVVTKPTTLVAGSEVKVTADETLFLADANNFMVTDTLAKPTALVPGDEVNVAANGTLFLAAATDFMVGDIFVKRYFGCW